MKQLLAGLLTATFFLLTTAGTGQEIYTSNKLEGYWTGALIRGSAAQIMTANFYMEDDTMRVATSIPDWTYYSPNVSRVEREGRVVKFNTQYGPATLVLDTNYVEMVGTNRTDAPALHLHLKKSLAPPTPKVVVTEIDFNVGDLTLKGSLVTPASYEGKLPCAIILHGRGCSARSWQMNRAKLLAQYGMAVVCYDKRGSGPTGVDCNSTTLTQHANDATEVLEAVAKRKEIDAKKIGLIGYSAGGWLAPKVAGMNKGKIAFIGSVVGPGTSIKDQQLDGGRSVMKGANGSTKALANLTRYTTLMFETGNPVASYKEMMALLANAEKEGWRQWLEATDIPTSADDLQNLWVNRWDGYDPTQDLAAFEGPFLSLLGETDDIVPYPEQVAAFKKTFGSVGKTNYRIVVIPAAWHGMEHGPKLRELGYVPELQSSPYYYKFDRVAYGAIDEILMFLRDYDFIAE